MIKQSLTHLLAFCKRVRLLLEIMGSLIALFLLCGLILLARLSVGPINLDSYIPQIETALKMPEIGLQASVEHLQLAWRDWDRPFEIELVNVHVQKDKNPHWLTVHHVGVSLQLYALLKGDIVLKQLHLYRPHILLEREEGGNFSLGFEDAPLDPHFSFKEVAPFLSLKGAPPFLRKFQDLRKISINDARIVLRDAHEGKTWTLPRLSLALHRYYTGSRATFTVLSSHDKEKLLIDLTYKIDQDFLELTTKFQQFSFHKFLSKARPTFAYDNVLSFLEQWAAPLTGKAHLALSSTSFQIIEGAGDLTFEKGYINSSLDTLPSLLVESGNMTFSFSPHLLDIKNFSLLSGEMALHFSGNLSSPKAPLGLFNLMKPGQTLAIEGKIEDFPLGRLDAFWPQNLAKPARSWLTENVKKGILSEGHLILQGHGEESGWTLDDLHGTLSGKEIELSYLKDMPPITGITAVSTFTHQGFDINVSSGKVDALTLHDGKVLITKLDTDNEELALVAKIKGPLGSALNVIKHEPIAYNEIDMKTTKGNIDLILHMSFPLLADLQFKDVKLNLKGSGKNVAFTRPLTKNLKAEFKNGSLTINLTQDKMLMKGRGDLNKIPGTTLTYTHHFTSSDSYKLQIEINTTVDFSDFSRLGFDCGDYAKGAARAKVVYQSKTERQGQLAVNLDTTLSSLSFPPLEWKKERGQKGEIAFVLHFDKKKLIKMDDLTMSSPRYSLKGNVLFNAHNEWKTIHLSQLKAPHTHTAMTLHALPHHSYAVSFEGKELDLEKVWEHLDKEDEKTNSQAQLSIGLALPSLHVRSMRRRLHILQRDISNIPIRQRLQKIY